jgi:hypothetical protein
VSFEFFRKKVFFREFFVDILQHNSAESDFPHEKGTKNRLRMSNLQLFSLLSFIKVESF